MTDTSVDIETGDDAASGLDYSRAGPIFALVFVDVLGLTVILPLLHLYGATFGANAFQIGLIAAAFPLAQLVGVPMMGALSDRFGRKPLLLISQITTCLSFVLLGLANTLWLVILSRVIDGLFGANLATAQAALSDITDEDNRAQGLGLTGAAFGLGFIFGPLTAILTLEMSDSLAIPAFTAATYSLVSIVLTWVVFEETLPPEKRGSSTDRRTFSPFVMLRMLKQPVVGILLLLMFAQQVVFFGFESLLGLFSLSQLGILGTGNALIFLFVGLILVLVQGRYIGKWSRRFGEEKLVWGALGCIALGLILLSFTPQQPHPLYVRELTQLELASQSPDSTEAIIGNIQVPLPENANRGIWGIVWLLIAIVPLSIGSGLIRPSLNTLMTKQVSDADYGSILGVSSSFVSAANATAPLIGGLLFQELGTTQPFLIGGVIMAMLFGLSIIFVR